MSLDAAGSMPRNAKKPPLRARLCLAAVASLALLAAAGCSASGGPGGTVSGTITIAAVPGVDNAPLYLAMHDGLFAAAGLHVSIDPEPSESAVLTALKDNQAQIAAADYGDIFSQQATSHDLRILADGYDATTGSLEVLALPNSPITSAAQLDNKKIGLPDDDILRVPAGDPDSLEAAAAISVLTNYVAGATVQWAKMSQSAEVSDLVNHRDGIQAILVSQPYIYEAESDAGAVEIMDAASGATASLPLSGYVAEDSWVKDNPAAVADFQSALTKAQSEASIAGPIQKALPVYTGISAQDADLATVGTYPTSTSLADLDRVERLMADAFMISPVNVGPMLVP
jgi:NitT/TauT family transport system substrate-binding protein